MTDVSARSQRARVYRHAKVPPNDGGIALGQAVIAAAAMRSERSAVGKGAAGARVY